MDEVDHRVSNVKTDLPERGKCALSSGFGGFIHLSGLTGVRKQMFLDRKEHASEFVNHLQVLSDSRVFIE